MSEEDNLENLILRRKLHIPIAKKELFNSILEELCKFFPTIVLEQWWFCESAWKSSASENYADFSLNPEYFYILKNANPSKPKLLEYERLRAEFKKNHDKILDDLHSLIMDDYPFQLHIDILKDDESGCDIEIECHPFLYFHTTYFQAKVPSMGKQHALLMCERYIKTLAISLRAKEIDKTESDIAEFTDFLGINRNWMSATYALQLQERSQ
jgi:hypothetical protein